MHKFVKQLFACKKRLFNEFLQVYLCLATLLLVYSSLLSAVDLILHCVNDKIDGMGCSWHMSSPSLSVSVNDLHIRITLGPRSEEGPVPHGGRLCVWIDTGETGDINTTANHAMIPPPRIHTFSCSKHAILHAYSTLCYSLLVAFY